MNPFLLNKADPESAHECVVGAVLWVLGWCGNGYSCVKTDFLSFAVAQGEFDVFVSSGMFIDIGVPEDYARAQTALSGR